MKREEFIKWMDESTIFDSVEYVWENLYWGGSSTEKREFKFEEFIIAYENDTIKW